MSHQRLAHHWGFSPLFAFFLKVQFLVSLESPTLLHAACQAATRGMLIANLPGYDRKMGERNEGTQPRHATYPMDANDRLDGDRHGRWDLGVSQHSASAAQDLSKGKAIYEKLCLTGHGPQGKGDGPTGKVLIPPATAADSATTVEPDRPLHDMSRRASILVGERGISREPAAMVGA
jgi:hypothetical protein